MFTRRWLIDTAERVAATFVEVFLAAVAAGQVTDVPTAQAAALAALTAVAAVLKAAIATSVGSADSASLVA